MKQITVQDIPSLWVAEYREIGFYLFHRQCRSSTMTRAAHVRYGKYCMAQGCLETYLLTVDHVVPISVAYYLNWTVWQTSAMSNLQLLCQKHHSEKDNPVVLSLLRSAASKYNTENQNRLSIPKSRGEVIVMDKTRVDKARGLMDQVLQVLREDRDIRTNAQQSGARELSEAITCFETGSMYMIRSLFADQPYTPMLKLQPADNQATPAAQAAADAQKPADDSSNNGSAPAA